MSLQTFNVQVHIDELRPGDDDRAVKVAQAILGEPMPDDTSDYGSIHLAFFDQARSGGDPGEKLAVTIGDALEEALPVRGPAGRTASATGCNPAPGRLKSRSSLATLASQSAPAPIRLAGPLRR